MNKTSANAYIIGAGATQVGEHFVRSLADLSSEAVRNAFAQVPQLDARHVGMVYVANALGEMMASQGQLGPYLAAAAGLVGVPALRIEAAGASSGVALHQAVQAVQAGACAVAVVIGAEKITDRLDAPLEAGLALAADAEAEGIHGVTLTGQWALLMRRYMHEHGYSMDAFAPFPVNAHANAAKNAQALYRFAISADKYRKANPIASPLNMLDCSTVADGAAAVIVASEAIARELPGPRIRVAGTSVATDTPTLGARRDPLDLVAARTSAQAALSQAQLSLQDVQVLELCDPHGIAAVLALESMGFYERGTAPREAADGAISPTGRTPLATAGGYKARGDVAGASGIYQVVELVRQLTGKAGPTQVAGARVALAQVLGGVGVTAATTLLVGE
ncbi:acetyl-CoA acetyltransferase-like protein [Oscillochloris trichoides DG-6]|uniref:Acetyl-CoA acetyltransferase-like protein n=1 Tax=Oscillochloris trichoides DG-6 TaxID=765420 RepID=E1ICT5_9CHLR|nr:acetyl-CoA acetyltransferase [Oscillochloris trichoides]EFO81033.1 acetyl-CoA acetyltransferase-like protein [Oscillochloris trichoides DG-6]